MKLIRFGKPGKEKPGVLRNDGARVDVSQFAPDYDEDDDRECKPNMATEFWAKVAVNRAIERAAHILDLIDGGLLLALWSRMRS